MGQDGERDWAEAGEVETSRLEAPRLQLHWALQTAMAFAGQHGVKYPTLMSWLGKRRREGGGSEPAPSFAELVVDEPGVERMGAAGLVVRLGGGMVVEIGSRTSIPLAVELIEALGSRR